MATWLIGYHELPLTELHESPLNPRKLFNQAALVELADSIRASGVITPLIVRPNAKGYEIAAGHRRYRAAKMAGKEVVPAVSREMDDAEFVEILNIENLQRQDLSALEEAEGYKLLMTTAGYDVKRIAERIGLSEKYVYDRVKLLNLIPAAQTLLRDSKITAGHAILIARQTTDNQKRILDEDGDALWQHEMVLEEADGGEPVTDPLKAKSVRELEGWIDKNIRFVATPGAVDVMLFPETAQVLADVQPKEKVVEITHLTYIPDEAREGKTIFPGSWERADGLHGSKTCEYSVLGVIAIGPGRGEAFRVCIAKEKCKVHWAAWQKARVQRATETAKAPSSSAGSAAERYKREAEERRQEEARAEAERARWKKATPAILEAVAAAVKKAPTKATGLLAQIIVTQVRGYNGPKSTGDYVPLGTSADDVVRHVAFMILQSEMGSWTARQHFPKRAKAFGIDVAKILDKEAPKPAPAAAAAAGSDAKKKSVTKKGKKK